MSHITATVEITTIAKTLSLRLPRDRHKQTHKAPMHTACTLKLPTVANTNPGTLYELKSEEPTTWRIIARGMEQQINLFGLNPKEHQSVKT